MLRSCTSVLAVVALTGAASADVFTTSLTVPAGGIGSVGTGPAGGSRVTIFSYGTTEDTVMRYLDPGAAVVASDDDGGPDLNSAFHYNVPASGIYTLQVSRFPDLGFTGNPGATFTTGIAACTGATGAESGSNGSYLTADAAIYGTNGFAMSGVLGTGDADFYAFNGLGGEMVAALIDNIGPDTLLGLFDSSGTLLAINDDGALSAGSTLQFSLPSTGTYYWAVSGYPDFGFTGSHSQSGDYLLIAVGGTAVPAPGVAGLIGLAGLVGLRRRR